MSNASDPILLIWHNEAQGPEVKKEDKEDIDNLGPCSLLFERDLQDLPSIFNRYNSRL